MNAYNQIDIGTYKKLLAFLKKKCVGYRAKTSKVFTQENISKFLNEAPNDIYLSEKVNIVYMYISNY